MFNKAKYYFILLLLFNKYLWTFDIPDLLIEVWSTEESYTFSPKNNSLDSVELILSNIHPKRIELES